MRTLVLYFSTTGHTKTVATLLAEHLGADLGEIRCPSYHTWLGWLAMARDIFARRRPLIEVPASVSGDYDLVVLGGPVWAGRPAPPIVSYLTGAGQSQLRYTLFVTCGGANPKYPPEAALAEIVALASGPVAATCVSGRHRLPPTRCGVMLRNLPSDFVSRWLLGRCHGRLAAPLV